MNYRLPYKTRTCKTRRRDYDMSLRIRKRSKTLPTEQRLVELEAGDALVHRGMLIDCEILDAILSTEKRLLWAFIRGDDNSDVMAVPYTEAEVLWMTERDVVQPEDVEI